MERLFLFYETNTFDLPKLIVYVSRAATPKFFMYLYFNLIFVCSSYLVSGDADGKCYIWDWKTTKLYKKWKAHDGVCIAALWHPHEPSKMLTAGWDGVIKYWD